MLCSIDAAEEKRAKTDDYGIMKSLLVQREIFRCKKAPPPTSLQLNGLRLFLKN